MKFRRENIDIRVWLGIGGVAIAIFGVYLSLFLKKFYGSIPLLFGIFLIVLPNFFFRYLAYKRIRDIEEQYPNFLRDLAESKKSGMTLADAIYKLSNVDYGALTKEVKKMSNQLSWGIPFRKVLAMFYRRIPSTFIKSTATIIIEAQEAGGDIVSTLEAVAEDARTLREVEKARKATMSQYVATIYIIYLFFIAILIVLSNLILQVTGTISTGAEASMGVGVISFTKTDPDAFRRLFFYACLIEGLCAGLVCGQIGENSVVAGIKHSILMFFIGFLAFLVAIFLPESKDIIVALSKESQWLLEMPVYPLKTLMGV